MPRASTKKQARQSIVPRDAAGKFLKGASGNPSGQRVIAREVKELAREYGPAAILRLAQLMRSADGPTAIAACRELLNRGYGRPESTVNLPGGGALVNVNLNGPIVTAEQAAEAYRQMLGNPAFDYSAITWAPPAPPTEPVPSEPAHMPGGLPPEPLGAEGSDPAAAPATPPVAERPKSRTVLLFEKLGRP